VVCRGGGALGLEGGGVGGGVGGVVQASTRDSPPRTGIVGKGVERGRDRHDHPALADSSDAVWCRRPKVLGRGENG